MTVGLWDWIEPEPGGTELPRMAGTPNPDLKKDGVPQKIMSTILLFNSDSSSGWKGFYNKSRARFREFRASILGFSTKGFL